MTFWTILETLLIEPLKLIFEIIFEYANRFVPHPGLAIIFLSLIMNILVLPLYRRADAMQEAIRDIEAKLQAGASHIKKTFSGDERMMILQTYYRQNHYKPTDALNGSISLLLEIPFFIAAYQFLSHLEILRGVSFGPIRDLGAPDGLLVLGGVSINLLPFIMTLVNFISSSLYLKGFPRKTKIQLYAMALFFLVFLYSSPSCLLFYWTLNNLFSLVKNIFYKLKDPQKILRILTAAAGLFFIVFGVFLYDTPSLKRKIFLTGLGILLLCPILLPRLKKLLPIPDIAPDAQYDRRLFLIGSLFLTVLTGLFIPSVFIAASPQEYVDLTYFHNPLWYIVRTLCYSAGTFLVWMRVFYGLASPRGKALFDRLVWILCGCMLINYMFFGTRLGTLSPSLQYENGIAFSRSQQLFNLLILLLTAAVLYFCVCKWKQAVTMILTVSLIALGGMAGRNILITRSSVAAISLQTDAGNDIPRLSLSKTGKNVIVLMLDRAMGEYVPYLFHEKPELERQFAGFTYYKNTISFGGYTNFGIPALLGGYEYTPVEMNKRSTEPLVLKHNEALKMMPVLFSQNGYEVTVCDPTYANYQWIPDLSVFDDYPEIKTFIANGRFGDPKQAEQNIQNMHRNFFCFSIMKTMPLCIQAPIYDNGLYHQIQSAGTDTYTMPQERYTMSTAKGVKSTFMNPYYELDNLPAITEITESETNTFLYLPNDITHEPMLLQEPDYVPAQIVDNTQYDAENTERFLLDGRELITVNEEQMKHYHSNMAAFLQLGKWFDYLRENDVYDNTRIILVSDHGRPLLQSKELMLDGGKTLAQDAEFYFPLLMVKDFDSREFTTSDTFMTNADVPALAAKDLIKNPKNPFTGKAISSDEKYAHDQFIILSYDWDVNVNNGNTYLPAMWASVRDNIWDKSSWTIYNKLAVLDQYAAP